VHAPSDPGTLQALHDSEQSLLQQTPSMQLLEAHWAADVHVAPLACGV
jgi:hypothetical protein